MARRNLNLTEKKINNILNFYNDDNSLDKTASHFGIGVDKIRDIIKQYGRLRTPKEMGKITGKGKLKIIDEKEIQTIINYYLEDHTMDETSKNLAIPIIASLHPKQVYINRERCGFLIRNFKISQFFFSEIN